MSKLDNITVRVSVQKKQGNKTENREQCQSSEYSIDLTLISTKVVRRGIKGALIMCH